jgi:hypothetical protein
MQVQQETHQAMSPTSSMTVPLDADLRIGAAVGAPAMIKMTMIITRHAGRRRTS